MTLRLSVTVSVWISQLIASECYMIKTQKADIRERLWDINSDTR